MFALGNIFRTNLNLPLSPLGSSAGTEQPVPSPGGRDPRAVPGAARHSRQSSGSSERSPQSSSVSHFHQKGMHLSFLQTNCDGETRF